MDRKQTINYLNTIINAKEMIKRKTENINELYSFLSSISIKYDKEYIKDSIDVNIRSKTQCEIVDYQKEIDKDIAALLKQIKDITSSIDMLLDPNEKSVLYMRYVNGYTWENIADIMNYSQGQCFRIHNKALSNIGKML